MKTIGLMACVSMVLVAACGGSSDPTVEGSSDARPLTQHVLVDREAPKAAASTTPHLTYNGGPVISNVKVVQVLYGSGTYLPQISGASSPTLGDFFQQVTNSAYFDWLVEYNTPTQTIGRGSFASRVQITPSSSRNGSFLPISDANIQAELAAQLDAGKLPPPDANTIYMVNFPKGKRISQGTSLSCVAGGFCAYHGTFVRNGSYVYYGVLPDMSSGSGCDTGCGSAAALIDNQTSVASHELVEAVTDAAVGVASNSSGPPLAWYDANNGEIGDICNAQQGTIVGSDGHTYTVQKEWSNAAGACIVSK